MNYVHFDFVAYQFFEQSLSAFLSLNENQHWRQESTRNQIPQFHDFPILGADEDDLLLNRFNRCIPEKQCIKN